MKLETLLDYGDIVIQCHDKPDADTIASGYALLRYLEKMGRSPRLVYAGPQKITRGNLHELIQKFDIPLEYLCDLEKEAELLVTVDCRAGERNVSALPCRALAVIDHHTVKAGETLPELHEIRTESDGYASCATVLWAMLREAGFPTEEDGQLSTILYYGLYMDTQELKTARKMDREMLDELKYDIDIVTELQSVNLSPDRLLTDYFEIPPREIRTGKYTPEAIRELCGADAALYRKKIVPVGCVKATNLFPEGEEILIRMLEGDVRKKVTPDLYLTIGIDGEVYHNEERTLLKNYDLIDEPFRIDAESPWQPKVYRYADRAVKLLAPYAKTCIAKDGVLIWAAKLNCRVKALTKWGEWHLGEPGDWLVSRDADRQDIYVIKKSVFSRTYEKMEGQKSWD